ncbi:MAG: trypsin-like serine protease [Pirellulaceae bacterium]|nr:trypsin-like serine protease [Pirellulaceae bacterium]
MKGAGIYVLLVALGLSAMLAGPAYSGTIRHDVYDSEYLALAASPAFDCVGRVDGTTSTSGFLASGTLIAPDWVLTAAHVVKGATSLDFTIGGVTYQATSWVAHSKFNADKLSAGYDIGLIRLGAPVSNINPASRYAGAAELGNVGISVGYGLTGTGLTGAVGLDGNKRAGENMVDTYYPVRNKNAAPNIILMDFDSPLSPSESSFGSSEPLPMEYLIAPGDSGGGLFADFGGGMELIGVHSFGWGILDGNPDSDYGDASGDTRVSVFNSWIDEALSGVVSGPGKSGGKGGGRPSFASADYEFGYFAVVVPEPSAIVLLLMAALGMAAWKRM